MNTNPWSLPKSRSLRRLLVSLDAQFGEACDIAPDNGADPGHRHPAPPRTGQPARPRPTCTASALGTYGVFFEYPHPGARHSRSRRKPAAAQGPEQPWRCTSTPDASDSVVGHLGQHPDRQTADAAHRIKQGNLPRRFAAKTAQMQAPAGPHRYPVSIGTIALVAHRPFAQRRPIRRKTRRSHRPSTIAPSPPRRRARRAAHGATPAGRRCATRSSPCRERSARAASPPARPPPAPIFPASIPPPAPVADGAGAGGIA